MTADINFNQTLRLPIILSSATELYEEEAQTAKDLVNVYQHNAFSLESSIAVAKSLIPKLMMRGAFDLYHTLNELLTLLSLKEASFQNALLEKMKEIIFCHFPIHNFNGKEYLKLTILEKNASEAIEAHIRSEGARSILYRYLDFYHDILEHLWLIPYLLAENIEYLILRDATIPFTCQHLQTWSRILERESKHDSELKKRLNYLDHMLRLFIVALPQKSIEHIQSKLRPLFTPTSCYSTSFVYLGELYGEQGHYSKSIEYYSRVLQTIKTLKDTQKTWLHERLGMAFQQLNEFNRALEHYQRCLELMHLPNIPEGPSRCAFVLSKMSQIYQRRGEDKKAIQACESILKFASVVNDLNKRQEMQADAYRGLGRIYAFRKEYQKAIGFYQYLLFASCNSGNRAEEGMAYNHLGVIYSYLQQYEEAREHLNRALQIAREETLPEVELIYHLNLGILEHSLRNYTQAIDEYNTYIRSNPSLHEQAMAFNNLGLTYLAMGNYVEAARFHQKSLQAALELNNQNLIFPARYNLANDYISLNKFSEALDCLNLLLENSDQASLARKSEIYGLKGIIYLKQKEYDSALKALNSSLDFATQAHHVRAKARAYGNLGNLYCKTAFLDEALVAYNKFLDIAHQLNDLFMVASAFSNLGFTYVALKQDNKAKEYLRKSVDTHSRLQTKLGENSEWHITFFEWKSNPMCGLEWLYLSQKKTEKALKVSESRRSPTLNSVLAKNLQLPSGADQVFSVDEMKALAAQQHATFLVYSVDREELFAWVISKTRIDSIKLPIENIQTELSNISETLKEFPFYRTLKGEPNEVVPLEKLKNLNSNKNNEDLKQVRRELKNALARWYEALIAPLEVYLPQEQSTLIIVPDNFLSQLPFGLFLDYDDHYLFERYPIATTPSLKTLKLLTRDRSYSDQVVVIGNPDTGVEAEKLPFSQEEAQRIGKLSGLDEKQILTGKLATPLAVQKKMQGSRLIFISCHGLPAKKKVLHGQISDLEFQLERNERYSVYEGCLKLAPDAEHPEGYLDAEKIAQLNLAKTEFVCLSSCFSGTGGLWQEGSIGLVRSFLAAGAASVLAAYWPVRDSEITVSMIEKMAENLLKPKESRLTQAKALQQIMKEMLEAYPKNLEEWGVFFLTGF